MNIIAERRTYRKKKMYQLWKEYKGGIEGLSTRYYAIMAALKDVTGKIPEA